MKHFYIPYVFTAVFVFVATVSSLVADEISIKENSFQSDVPLIRAERPCRFEATIHRIGRIPYSCRLIVPNDGSTAKERETTRSANGFPVHSWEVVCAEPGQKEFTLELIVGDVVIEQSTVSQTVLPPRKIEKLDYVPPPKPVKTKILVGAHNCPLWEREKSNLWNQVVFKHQERTPALGIYAQDNPEIADWETKWALDHGISFFIYCWYRDGQGGPVRTKFEKSVFDDALFKSRYGDQMKFTIMWENQHKGRAGVADEKDLMENLLPYWIEKFFKRDNYLKIDNKPVLFVYMPTFLADDLGGDDKAKAAYDLMREGCKKAGFDGLYLLGEYRGTDPNILKRFKTLGLDYTFAYCWHVPNSPPPNEVIEAQKNYVRQTQAMNDILPQVITLSQAWSGWQDEGSIWKLSPKEFEELLRWGRDFVEKEMPKDELGGKMLILDNWNEWSEGHYLAPYREYGFGYLDAVRRVFSVAPEEHEDLIPQDVGLGPYDLPRSLFEPRTNWTFDDGPQGWSIMMGVENLRGGKDKLVFKTTSLDPAVSLKLNELPAANFHRVVVRMRTDGEKGDTAQFLWKSDTDADYSEVNSVRAPIRPSKEFQDLTFDLADKKGWKGKIVSFRFDPVSTEGLTVEIESIRLESRAGIP